MLTTHLNTCVHIIIPGSSPSIHEDSVAIPMPMALQTPSHAHYIMEMEASGSAVASSSRQDSCMSDYEPAEKGGDMEEMAPSPVSLHMEISRLDKPGFIARICKVDPTSEWGN